ncbi:MAG: hypothetical protein AB7P50_22570 [Alphaproteobacteria bacterium]
MTRTHTSLTTLFCALLCTAALISPALAQERPYEAELYASAQEFDAAVTEHYGRGFRVVDFDTCYNAQGVQTWAVVYHQKDFPESGEFDSFVQASNWNEFNAEVGLRVLQGWRVDDMDTAGQTPTGAVTHTAIMNHGPGGQYLINTTDWARFDQQRRRRVAEGMRLVDIDVAFVRGQLRFYGVMRPATHDELVVRENQWSGFEARREQLAAQGWQLVDFGVTSTVVVGVFNRIEGQARLLQFPNWAQLGVHIEDHVPSDLVMMDIECRMEGSNLLYAALWRTPGRSTSGGPGHGARPPQGAVVDPGAPPTQTAPGDRDRGRPDAMDRPRPRRN